MSVRIQVAPLPRGGAFNNKNMVIRVSWNNKLFQIIRLIDTLCFPLGNEIC